MSTLKHKIYASNEWLAQELTTHGFLVDTAGINTLKQTVQTFLQMSRAYIHIVYAHEFLASLKKSGVTNEIIKNINAIVKIAKSSGLESYQYEETSVPLLQADAQKKLDYVNLTSQLKKYNISTLHEAFSLIEELIAVKKILKDSSTSCNLLDVYKNPQIPEILCTHLKKASILSLLREVLKNNLHVIAKAFYMQRWNITQFSFNNYKWNSQKTFITSIRPLLECNTTDDINNLSSKFGDLVTFFKIPTQNILSHQYNTNGTDSDILLNCMKLVLCINSIQAQTKLLTGYIIPTINNLNGGKVRFKFNACSAITHRWSSQFHSFPLHADIFSSFKLRDDELGFYIDINAAEIRTIAMLSQDKNLNRIFSNKEDPYTHLAKTAYPDLKQSILLKIRARFKVVFFQLLFGSSIQRISNIIGISVDDVKKLVKTIFSEFPNVKEYMSRVIDEAKTTKCVRTFFGEKIPVKGGSETTKAVNYTIQGTSSLIIADGFANFVRKGYNSKLQITPQAFIHDCIIGTFKANHFNDFLKELSDNFTNYIFKEYNMPIAYKLRLISNNFREKIEVYPMPNNTFKLVGYLGAIKELKKKTNFKLIGKPVVVADGFSDPLEHTLQKKGNLRISNLFVENNGSVDKTISCTVTFPTQQNP